MKKGMEGKVISLRYAGVCAICGDPLAVGTKASWHQESRTVKCLSCAHTPASTTSIAGRSAERKAERLAARRLEQTAPARWTLRRRTEPDPSAAWRKGARGEEILGAKLNKLREDGMIVRHDLRVPGSRAANIDHVVVARSGIHVIDAKNYAGQIRLRRRGSQHLLYVGSRNRTSLVEKLAGQILAVEAATKELNLPTPITPALCFVHGDWPLFCHGYSLNGVHILWFKKLRTMLSRRGPLTDAQMSAAGQLIFERLPLA